MALSASGAWAATGAAAGSASGTVKGMVLVEEDTGMIVESDIKRQFEIDSSEKGVKKRLSGIDKFIRPPEGGNHPFGYSKGQVRNFDGTPSDLMDPGPTRKRFS